MIPLGDEIAAEGAETDAQRQRLSAFRSKAETLRLNRHSANLARPRFGNAFYIAERLLPVARAFKSIHLLPTPRTKRRSRAQIVRQCSASEQAGKSVAVPADQLLSQLPHVGLSHKDRHHISEELLVVHFSKRRFVQSARKLFRDFFDANGWVNDRAAQQKRGHRRRVAAE